MEQENRNNYYAPADSQSMAVIRRPEYLAGNRRDLTFGVILAVLAVLFVNCWLWHGLAAGAGLLAAALFFTGICYLWKSRKGLSAYGCVCAALFVAAAVSLAFSDGGQSKDMTLLLMAVLCVTVLMELMDLRRYSAGTYRSVADGVEVAFAMSFGGLPRGVYALFHTGEEDGTKRKRRIGSVLLGVLCAVPALLVVLPLLASSDAAFSGLLDKLAADWLGEAAGSLLLGLFFFLLVFSLLFTARTERREKKQQTEGNGVSTAAVCAFLSAISFVYVLYLLSQLAYFFSAFSGILPQDYTVSAYARRGFFEMSAVCAINLLLVGLALIASKKKDGKAALCVRLLSLFLCLFSLLLVATALSKMGLYVHRYGMTRLRILTSVFMVFLAVVFVAVGLRLFVRRVPYMKVAVLTAGVLTVAMSFANVDRVVAAYNVDAYQTGKLDTIDMDTLSEMSDAAVPYLLELTGDDNAQVQRQARRILFARLEEEFEVTQTVDGQLEIRDTGYDLRAFDTVTYRARQLLLENWQKFAPQTNPA